jgi:hypothetical protein
VLNAAGAIRTRGRLARFEVRGTHGKRVGLVLFTDAGARIRLRTTTISRIAFGVPRKGVTVRGTGVNLATGRHLRFTIVLVNGAPKRFRISLSGGYVSKGSLVSGHVTIAA